MRLELVVAVVGALLLASSPVRADRLYVMPPLDVGSEFGTEIMVGTIDIGVDDATLLGLDVVFRHRIDQIVLSARLPIAHLASDPRDGTALGNLTAGLDYLFGGGSRNRVSRSAVGFSLSLPTAADSGDAGFAARTYGIFYVPDRGRYWPDTTTLRLHGSHQIGGHNWFLQGQLGTDFLIIDGADDLLLLRFGLGAGIYVAPHLALQLELTTISDALDDNNSDEDFWHTLDVGMRYYGGGTSFGARIYYPLDDSLRNLSPLGLGLDFVASF